MDKYIDITKSEGLHMGFCRNCRVNFHKGDYVIMFEDSEINQIKYIKVCAKCYLKFLADKMGWGNMQKLIIKMTEEKL